MHNTHAEFCDLVMCVCRCSIVSVSTMREVSGTSTSDFVSSGAATDVL